LLLDRLLKTITDLQSALCVPYFLLDIALTAHGKNFAAHSPLCVKTLMAKKII
jgi:hypothetical protein